MRGGVRFKSIHIPEPTFLSFLSNEEKYKWCDYGCKDLDIGFWRAVLSEGELKSPIRKQASGLKSSRILAATTNERDLGPRQAQYTGTSKSLGQNGGRR